MIFLSLKEYTYAVSAGGHCTVHIVQKVRRTHDLRMNDENRN